MKKKIIFDDVMNNGLDLSGSGYKRIRVRPMQERLYAVNVIVLRNPTWKRAFLHLIGCPEILCVKMGIKSDWLLDVYFDREVDGRTVWDRYIVTKKN